MKINLNLGQNADTALCDERIWHGLINAGGTADKCKSVPETEKKVSVFGTFCFQIKEDKNGIYGRR